MPEAGLEESFWGLRKGRGWSLKPVINERGDGIKTWNNHIVLNRKTNKGGFDLTRFF